MAESSNDVILIDSDDETIESELCASVDNKPNDYTECPICLQQLLHPAKLPCGHIFCFLCVKGVAYKNRKCAMCRREIPSEYLDHPQLVHGIDDLKKTLNNAEENFQWFYEGRNGWWKYDERTSQEIEESYQRQEKFCGIFVAGFVYTVDFEEMVQLRKNDPSRKRVVKRDLSTIQIKGVAGLRIDGNCITTTTNDTTSSDNFISSIAADTDAAILIASNIIDSTLAHVDDEIQTAATNETAQTQQVMSSIGICNNSNHQGHNLPIENIRNLDNNRLENLDSIFTQTLDGFRRLTLNNVINSSESEDEDPHTIL